MGQLDSHLPGITTNSFLLVDISKNSFAVLLTHGFSLVDQTFSAKAPFLKFIALLVVFVKEMS
jgi:hypothetical protein